MILFLKKKCTLVSNVYFLITVKIHKGFVLITLLCVQKSGGGYVNPVHKILSGGLKGSHKLYCIDGVMHDSFLC